jgi:hypothetical protein
MVRGRPVLMAPAGPARFCRSTPPAGYNSRSRGLRGFSGHGQGPSGRPGGNRPAPPCYTRRAAARVQSPQPRPTVRDAAARGRNRRRERPPGPAFFCCRLSPRPGTIGLARGLRRRGNRGRHVSEDSRPRFSLSPPHRGGYNRTRRGGPFAPPRHQGPAVACRGPPAHLFCCRRRGGRVQSHAPRRTPFPPNSRGKGPVGVARPAGPASLYHGRPRSAVPVATSAKR